jgi:tRNA threonylcarbamoyladenosine biosynthesis protein TsaE
LKAKSTSPTVPGGRRRPRKAEKSRPLFWISKSAADTVRLARAWAETFRGDEVVFLIGELGAGKTVFAKGLAAGLGLKDIRPVCSPTFTLMNVYQARVPIFHLDLYRLGRAAEIRDLGFEDLVGDGVIIVEWGEKIDFPMAARRVEITVGKDGIRRFRVAV